MAVTANWVSLIYAFGPVSWLLTTILLLGEFLYFNLRPIEKSGAPTKRIWYLKSGCELLRLFLITATVTVFVQMVWLWCQISMITPENSLAAEQLLQVRLLAFSGLSCWRPSSSGTA